MGWMVTSREPPPRLTEAGTPTMLASLVLQLKPEAPGTLPRTTGHLTHAAFLKLVRQVDLDLERRLHADTPAKPFTVSPLQGGRSRNHMQAIEPTHPCYLRFTSLDATLSAALLGVFSYHPPPLMVGAVTFSVCAVHSTAQAHPWAGRDSYEAMAARFAAPETPVASSLRLQFDSPTTFSQSGSDLPLPLPRLVVGSLVRKWRRHAPLSLQDLFDGWEAEQDDLPLLLKRYQLNTEKLAFADGYGGHRVGFVGEAEFMFPEEASENKRRLLQLLGRFAFFAGIGYQTTRGMGQVRPLTCTLNHWASHKMP